jgi:signal peptidase
MNKNPHITTDKQLDLLRQELSIAQDAEENAGVKSGISKNSKWKIFLDVLFFITVFVLVVILVSVLTARMNGNTPEIFGVRLYVVQTASMEPTLDVGSIIFTIKPSDSSSLRKDDIITFVKKDGKTVTHRIIAVVTDDEGNVFYQTKGDNPINTPDVDLVSPDMVQTVFVLKIPLT